MYHATIDAEGAASGFYCDEIHARIPEGAVPLTEAEWRDWVEHQAERRWLDGVLVAIEPPTRPLVQVQAVARAAIDAAAEGARLRTITPGAGQALTYIEKEKDARAYAAAGYPSAQLAEYPFVDAERQALGTTGRKAAELIIATADAWRKQAARIERRRREGKAAVEAAATPAAAESACDEALAALESL